MDKLEDIFKRQEEFQARVRSRPILNVQFVKDMTLAAVCELMEALQEIPWKPWKKNQSWDQVAFRNELIDVLHFLINLFISAGMSADDVYLAYLNKNKINHKRQDEGY